MVYILKKKVTVATISISLLLLVLQGSYADTSAESDKEYVPIIMYHEIKTFKAGKDVITPQEFENDLKFLKENNYTAITMTDLVDYVYNETELLENPIIITFDDGYLNNYVYAFPLIMKYDMKIVFSIIGKNTDDFTDIPDDNVDYSHVTWSQLKEMIDSGLVEVQNHTYNLHRISKKRFGCAKNKSESLEHYENILREDLEKLQTKILENTGVVPNSFVYPYGRFNKDSVPILKNLGFQASLTCDYGVNVISHDPDGLFGLKRICRSHGKPVSNLIVEAMKTIGR